MWNLHKLGGALGCLVLLAAGSVTAATREKPAPIVFNRDIRPILSENCFACHGPDNNKRKAKLRLDTHEGILEKHDDHSAVVPGKSTESELVRRITTTDEEDVMPPPATGKKLTPKQIDLLKRWIDEGASWQGHWSFLTPERPPLPKVRDARWARNEIDYFILEKVEEMGLKPSPETDKIHLIRRVTFDLTGLPPTPQEVDAFLSDHSSKAYERLVDRLLASPQYGERMALHWLDLARFADTHGYHLDAGRDMTKWRDWVIGAFNQDEPFNQFVVEQLAGDLLPNATVEQKVATGFNRNNMINFEGGAIPEEYLTAYIIDRINTTSTVFLGLTLGCCQCHDHKYDPFTQKDFYRMYAYFNAVPEKGLDGVAGNAAPLLSLPSPEQKAEQARMTEEIKRAEKALRDMEPALAAAQAAWEKDSLAKKAAGTELSLPKEVAEALAAESRSDSQKAALAKYFREKVSEEHRQETRRIADLKKSLDALNRKIPTVMVMEQMAQPRDTFVLTRGQYNQPGEKVTPGVPGILAFKKDLPPNRLGLAEWMTDPSNPLLARVTVNRFWAMLMGTGIVKTANDFGSQGEWPSHPQLLDWLATEFVRTGWDVKRMMKLIVMSATYRQSSAVLPLTLEKDPYNRYYARGPRFRLQAEMIRDEALAVSGLLVKDIGGASVLPYQPAGLWEELCQREDSDRFSAQKYVQSHGPDLYRRSMYTFWKRTCPPPSLQVFDAPDRETCTVNRDRTTTPLQALALMNDPTYVEASRFLAERLIREGGRSPEQRIQFGFRIVTSRRPEKAEAKLLLSFYQKQLERYRSQKDAAVNLLAIGEGKRDTGIDPAEHAAWTLVASTLLNLDEAVTKN